MPCNCQNGLRSGAICPDCKGTTFVTPKVAVKAVPKTTVKPVVPAVVVPQKK